MKIVNRISVYIWAMVLILIDQATKVIVINNIKFKSIGIIKGFLRFTYCENKGVAFSFGEGHVIFFVIINLLIIGGLIIYYEKNRETEFKGIWGKIPFIMVIAGGISNLIDRIIRGFVVDFIDIGEIFDFAVFNVADMFIVCGVIALAINFVIKGIKVVNK